MNFNQETYNNFVNDFSVILRNKINNLEISKLIFLCIGTDRITGDSFGPLIGYKLSKVFKEKENIEVIGNLENTVCMHNIKYIMQDIKNKYEEPFLIAIDAALSNKNNIGKIIVTPNGMNVGTGLNKKSIYVGDMSIKGIVTKDFKNPKYNFKLLQNTSLGLIMNMADSVVQGIYDVMNV